jgi:hypothetical protein
MSKREKTHPSNSVDKVKTEKVSIEIEGAPKGEWKALGGSDHDKWNKRISRPRSKRTSHRSKERGGRFGRGLRRCIWHGGHEAH